MTIKEHFVEAYRRQGYDFMTACEKATEAIEWVWQDPREIVPVGIGTQVFTVKKEKGA